jgi:beta-glucosidase
VSHTFPKGFLWGAATASYQIEGASREDGKGESIWDRFSHTPGRVLNGDTGDVACDHYHRWREDIALMRELGLKSCRFSIAWPRVFPNGTGEENPAGLAFYSRLVDALLEAGITPAATLYHWDLPQALEDRGGWPNRETASAFADYAERCFRVLGDRVPFWITLNEPWVIAHLGYLTGEHAPGHRDLGEALAAGHTLLLAHGLAVERYRALGLSGQIGLTVNLSPAHAVTPSPEDRAAATRWEAYTNRWFLDPVFHGDYPEAMRAGFGGSLPSFTPEEQRLARQPIDLIGINYYSRSLIRHDPNGTLLQIGWGHAEGAAFTDMGWEIYPDGLRETLLWVRDQYGPVDQYVTENGAAFPDAVDAHGAVPDEERRRYLRDHFIAAHQALAQGVPLRGYYVWSLLDNFEWAFGYTKRFGIIYVDYPTQRRIPKASARWYRSVIDRNAVPTEAG